MILTIAIPTFNRNDILLSNLTVLMPQLNSSCELLIIDNCSDIPIKDTLDDLIHKYANIKVRIVRNRFNIGANANLLRCFEIADTDWIWILGDDDCTTINAISTVLDGIDKYADAVFINFLCSIFSRSKTRKVFGIDEFIDKLDHFANILCISVNIFHISKINKYLQYGYQYCYSCGPHVALMLRAIGNSEPAVLSSEIIISRIATGEYSDYWSSIPVALGLNTLIENTNGFIRKMKLNKKIMDLSFRVTYELLIYRQKGTISKKEMMFYYNQIMYRKHYFGFSSIKAFFYSIFYRMCLTFGSGGLRFLNWLCNKKHIKQIVVDKYPY